MWRKGTPTALLVGMQTGEATVENSIKLQENQLYGKTYLEMILQAGV